MNEGSNSKSIVVVHHDVRVQYVMDSVKNILRSEHEKADNGTIEVKWKEQHRGTISSISIE